MWEEEHQTGVLTQKLIDEHGMIPQTILREAVADYYSKIMQTPEQSQIETDELIVVPESETLPSLEILAPLSEKSVQENSSLEVEQIIIPEVEEFSNNENLDEDNSLASSVTGAPSVEEQETLAHIGATLALANCG